jgi:hypothetical protein
MRHRPIFSSRVTAAFLAIALVVAGPLAPAHAVPSARAVAAARAFGVERKVSPAPNLRPVPKLKHAPAHKRAPIRKKIGTKRPVPGTGEKVTGSPVKGTPSPGPPTTTVSTTTVSTTTVPSQTAFELTGPSAVNRLSAGVTFTGLTVNSWDPSSAVTRAKTILADVAFQNEWLMGAGLPNPEPSPGVYDFQGLDERLALAQATGGTPVMTLCGAPDWMKGGLPGQTNWSNFDAAPLPQYYGAFAQLAVTVAKRYPAIRYFQIWSELRGFWDSANNRWNYQAYTTFYNTVYDALKAYDPTLSVGGPYVVFGSSVGPQSNPSSIHGPWGTLDQRPLDVMSYWLAHKHGADFVAIDGSTAPIDQPETSPFLGVEKLAAITDWVRSQTSLPIWWSEVYPVDPSLSVSPDVAAAVTSDVLTTLALSGASVALLWQQAGPGGSCIGSCLWTDARQASGGQLTQTGTAVLRATSLLVPGAAITAVGDLPPAVSGFAVGAEVLLINTTSEPEIVATPQGALDLPAYAMTANPLT